jgi:ribosomal protein S18 acetylase RimI-like enzyme
MLERLLRRRKNIVSITNLDNVLKLKPDLPSAYEVRWLKWSEILLLHSESNAGAFTSPPEYYRRLMDNGAMLTAIFYEKTPVAWKFCMPNHQDYWGWARICGGPNCAFLIAAYTDPKHRGKWLQTALNCSLAEKLQEQGITHFGAIREPQNSSSRGLFLYEGFQDLALLHALYLPFGFKLVWSRREYWFGRYSKHRRFIYQIHPATVDRA